MFTKTFQIIEDKIKITTGAVVLFGLIDTGKDALRHKWYQRRYGPGLRGIIWTEGSYTLWIDWIKQDVDIPNNNSNKISKLFKNNIFKYIIIICVYKQNSNY